MGCGRCSGEELEAASGRKAGGPAPALLSAAQKGWSSEAVGGLGPEAGREAGLLACCGLWTSFTSVTQSPQL